MAYADYRHCDVCDAKAFYDAGLDYDTKPPIAPAHRHCQIPTAATGSCCVKTAPKITSR